MGNPNKEAQRYIALANLKKVPEDLIASHGEEIWHVIRSLAVLDWTLRQAGTAENGDIVTPHLPEAHFETIMRNVQQIAEAIQDDLKLREALVH